MDIDILLMNIRESITVQKLADQLALKIGSFSLDNMLFSQIPKQKNYVFFLFHKIDDLKCKIVANSNHDPKFFLPTPLYDLSQFLSDDLLIINNTLGEVCVTLKHFRENLLLAKIAEYNALINKSPSKVHLDVASLINKVHTNDLVSNEAKSGLLGILDKKIKEFKTFIKTYQALKNLVIGSAVVSFTPHKPVLKKYFSNKVVSVSSGIKTFPKIEKCKTRQSKGKKKASKTTVKQPLKAKKSTKILIQTFNLLRNSLLLRPIKRGQALENKSSKPMVKSLKRKEKAS
ncbi:hypothetical protein G9A89_000973 [Geosiphon pyriformis]|nr:hypothetical protein G9A89_000973 [Geosiphon pyriformis]